MRRILAIAAVVLAIGLLIALPGALGAGSGGAYEVRGVFDNGAFVVEEEEGRGAGATVGTVKEVNVSDDDEIVSREGGDHAVPGKAVVVMDITEDGFKDFRIDASCTIRPQSLIGERYIDCTPTEPRAPGEPPFPETLREVRLTMSELKEFADQGTPLFADLRISGENISRATQELVPFGRAAVPALTTLGNAAEAAGPKIAASDPLLTDLASAAHAAVPVGNNLAPLFDTFIKTGGFRSLADFIYNTSAATNGFDSFGHFLRINVQVTNCIDVSSFVVQGCEAFFQNLAAPATKKKKKRKARSSAKFRGGPLPEPAPQSPAAPLELPPLELTP